MSDRKKGNDDRKNGTAFSFVDSKVLHGRLTQEEKMFCLFYVNHQNGVRAAREAGYGGDDAVLSSVAHENLRKPKIKKVIAELSDVISMITKTSHRN